MVVLTNVYFRLNRRQYLELVLLHITPFSFSHLTTHYISDVCHVQSA